MDREVPPEVDAHAAKVVDAAFHVHRSIGPGALESVYQHGLEIALRNRGVSFEREVWIDIEFEGVRVPRALRADFVIERTIVVDPKAVTALHPVHYAQLLSYLRLTGLPLGLLIDFHAPLLKQGIVRMANTRAAPPGSP